MRARIDLRSVTGGLLMVVGILWLWWGYVASTAGNGSLSTGSVWFRVAGGIALIIIGFSIWFMWRSPRP